MRTIRSRMPPLRQRLLEDLRLRNSSPDTLRCYLRGVADFAQPFGGSPPPLGPAQGRPSQRWLVEETHMAWPSVVQAVCAVRFCSRVTRGRPGMLEYSAHPRWPFPLPTMLSQAAVAALLTASRNLQPRAILTPLYAAGLRVSALCQVPVTDIDSAPMVLRVRQGPGQPARSVLLAPTRLPLLRHYGQPEQPRPWLLPGHPRPRPITTRAVSHICRDTGQAAPLPQALHPPVLRHSFAPPLLEAGVARRRIQLLLGHRSLRPPSRALHVTPQALHAPPRPLEALPLDAPLCPAPPSQWRTWCASRALPLWHARAPPWPRRSTAPSGRLRSVALRPSGGMRRSVSSVGTWRAPRTPGAIGIAPSVQVGRKRPGSRLATLRCLTCPPSMWGGLSRMPAAHARATTRGCCRPSSCRRWPRPFARWHALRTIWGRRSASSPCCIPGGRRCPTIPTCTVACLGAGWHSTGAVASLSVDLLPVGPCAESRVPPAVPHQAPSSVHGGPPEVRGAMAHAPPAATMAAVPGPPPGHGVGGVCQATRRWSWTGIAVSRALYASRSDRDSSPAGARGRAGDLSGARLGPWQPSTPDAP
jgi:hypothetical protein